MGKRIEAAKTSYDAAKTYSVAEAAKIVKDNAKAKFDETVEIHIALGIDTKKADQQVRSTVVLPAGTGKTKKIAVVAKGEKAKEAQDAGADIVGGDDIIEEVMKGVMNFDILLATPDTMKDLSKAAKVLGPRGLMPNPKSGTVTFDLAQAIKELKAGRIEFKADAYGIVHTILGKTSFTAEKIAENAKAVLETVIRIKPATAKGVYVKSITMSSTMGPGVRVDGNKI